MSQAMPCGKNENSQGFSLLETSIALVIMILWRPARYSSTRPSTTREQQIDPRHSPSPNEKWSVCAEQVSAMLN